MDVLYSKINDILEYNLLNVKSDFTIKILFRFYADHFDRKQKSGPLIWGMSSYSLVSLQTKVLGQSGANKTLR